MITKKSILSGALILTFAGIICKLIGAISKIPLTNILTSEGIGIYQLIFPLYSLLLLVSSSGIPIAISKIISEKQNANYAKNVTKYALKFILTLSVILSIIVAVLSNIIAKFQGNLNATYAYITIAPAIIFVAVISVLRGYFQGMQNFTPTAVSQIIEQVIKITISISLALILTPINMVLGVIGAVLGITLSELAAMIYLVILYKKNIRKKYNDEILVDKRELRRILVKTATPITLTSIILPLLSLIDSFMFMQGLINQNYSPQLLTSMYGIESGVVSSLLNLPIVLASSISSALIPAIASNNNSKNSCEFAFKSIIFVMLPIVIFYVLFANSILEFLYSNALSSTIFNLSLYARNLLMISSVSIVYVSIMQICTAILQAKNFFYTPLIVYIVSGVIKIVINFILLSVPKFNIYCISVSSVLMYFVSAAILLIIVKNQISFKLNYTTHILFPISILTIISIVFYPFIKNIGSNFINIMIGGITFVLLAWFILIMFGFYKKEVLPNFKFKNKKIVHN